MPTLLSHIQLRKKITMGLKYDQYAPIAMHIVQIHRLGYKKLQEKSEAAMRLPLQRASKRAPT